MHFVTNLFPVMGV